MKSKDNKEKLLIINIVNSHNQMHKLFTVQDDELVYSLIAITSLLIILFLFIQFFYLYCESEKILIYCEPYSYSGILSHFE